MSTVSAIALAFPFALVLLAPLMNHLHARRCRRALNHDDDDHAAAEVRAALRRSRITRRDQALGILGVSMAREGAVDQTYRICAAHLQKALTPIKTSFEPCPLDDAEAAFDERRASVTGPNTAASAEGRRPARRNVHLAFMRFRQNVEMRSGWLVLVCFLVLFGLFAYQSILLRRLDFHTIVFGALLAALLFASTRAGVFSPREWLVLPGGLLVRRGGVFSRGFAANLFDRRHSVLFVAHYSRRTWHVIVANRERYETFVGTDAEVEFLLSAWLSPLRPPPLERMSDLT
jgi:hypothetical protein